MMPEKFRLAFVSNSSTIANVVKSCATQFDSEIEIHLATMEEALPVARQLIASGVEVILGGGATGKFLRLSLDLPVVTIARTHLDILRACIKAKQFGNRIWLTSYDVAPDGLDLLGGLMGITLQPIVFRTTPELLAGIAEAVAKGADCIVGGGVCQEIAATHGKEGVVVVPGKEAIQRALEEAQAIASAQRKERAKAERLRCILESIHEGVLGVDTQGRVDVLNRLAADQLGLDPAQTLGRTLPEALGNTGVLRVLATGGEETDQILRLAGVDMVVNARPIRVGANIEGAVATLGPVSRIRSIDRKLQQRGSAKGFVARYSLKDLKGDCPAMAQLKARALRFARTDASLLIQGETGTGKEILAQSVHAMSDRRRGRFVAVNCAALPESLLESELFGYEEGAFTGAKRGGKDGLFVIAHGGTIFLDEIADIPKSLQVRLLRVLEEREIMRVGGDRIVPVDVRIISSTYKDLTHEVRHERFRADLYFRLGVLSITLPPLRERIEDLPLLTQELLVRHGLRPDAISVAGLKILQQYSWPGNVRELDALIRRYALLREGPDTGNVLVEELLMELESGGTLQSDAIAEVPSRDQPSTDESLKAEVEAYEAEVIQRTLREVRYNKREAARRLGISVNTLWRKLKE